MIEPPLIRGGAVLRGVSLVVGLFLFALGIVLQLQSDLGLSPWDVLNQGISDLTSLSFGTANIVVALVVLAVAWALGARIGIGTVANAVLIGLFVDGLLRLDAIDSLIGHGLGVRIALLVAGIAIIALGSGFYLGAAPISMTARVTPIRTPVRRAVTIISESRGPAPSAAPR